MNLAIVVVYTWMIAIAGIMLFSVCFVEMDED